MTVNGKLDTRALPAPEYTDGDRYRAPATPTEEILAGIYAQVLGLERVGVDDSFFELGGDSILSMQVVARARAAGLLCRPRDVFVEQTVARLARVVEVAEGAGGVVDEGVGAVVATPIMRRLHGVEGPVDEFNQTVVVQAPVGVSEADVVALLQGLVDRHAMLRLRVEEDGAGGWSLTVPEAGSVQARECLQVVEVLSDEALVAARSRLNPAAGVMLGALWVAVYGSVGVDRSPFGGGWGVVADPVGRFEYCLGPASWWAADSVAGGRDVVCPLVGTVGGACPCPRGGGPGAGVAAGGGGPGRAAGGATRGGYLCQRWAVVGGAGCRDHPDAAGGGAGGVSCRGARDFGDRVRVGGRGVFGCRRGAGRY